MNKLSSNYRENTLIEIYFFNHIKINLPEANTLLMHLYCIQSTTGIFRFCHCFVFGVDKTKLEDKAGTGSECNTFQDTSQFV